MFLAVVSGPLFAVTVAGTLIEHRSASRRLLRRVRRIFREARENEDALLRSFSAMTLGIKELKLHRSTASRLHGSAPLGAAGDLRDQNVDAGSWFSVAHGYGQPDSARHHGSHPVRASPRRLQLPGDVWSAIVLVTIFLAMPMQHFMSRLPDLLRGDVALAKIRELDL